MDRREALKLSLLAGAGLVVGIPQSHAAQCPGDGTPTQFLPKQGPDPQAHENDIAKYPKCPYCGMDRKQFHHSRMLIQYADDLADGTCSIHCAAISLSLNIDREPKALWVGDNAATAEVKPLVDVDKASFLIGSSIKGVMTKRSKVAYGTATAATAARAANGGELANFDQALLAAYTDMSQDVSMIRKNRAERRKRMMEQQGKPAEHKS
ncbi:MAG: nitrous oxide reductase accessory protein NosL [Gammaproteobacteria bacterium]|nr:twin-arginine translocation pathway signal protein [Rhodocyclaceae bacterium]MBU3908194.1 nitrous oxide reductase accessory protein NosL [Gammaproteobacteria bacterium]MBU3988378.1 nitrous oxide reductase accessory protein NosL [Gammaproteobacteria bacterium]MBU4005981.1 nitrous oxide reductase accessory protein NosL [Gammaproteobacteria bacterium]MBU4020013.1 nitrous oxide reductase accessory protein NosL [Gammaproteobacteria bacterium]